MTASAMESDRKSCQQAGMVDFVAKPINLISLKEKIEIWAEKIIAHRNRMQLAPPGPAAAGPVAAGAGSSSIPPSPTTAVQRYLKPKVLSTPAVTPTTTTNTTNNVK